MSEFDDSFVSAHDSETFSSDDSFCSVKETLGDTIRLTFSHRGKHALNVCHINAQSVPSHYSDLLETFTDSNVHAILISESWLKPHLLSTSYPLPGYVLLRNDRLNRRGGGVALYLRSNLIHKIVACSPSHSMSSAEFLFTEVWVGGAKLLLGVVYCPPTVDYFTDLESVLESLGPEYEHHVVMGDFNTNLLSHCSSRSLKLLQIIESASLQVLPLKPTHYNPNGEDTWLDLILVSVPSLVLSQGQLPAPSFSHHDLIFLSYNLKPPKPKPKVLHMRSFARMDQDKMVRDASNIDWSALMAAPTVDDKVHVFCNKVLGLYDIHAPVKRVKLRRPPAPWLTRGVQMAMRRRDRAFRKFRKERNDTNWALFKTARNRCNQMIRNAKRRHILENISSSTPAGVWKFLRTLGIGKSANIELPKTISLNDINRHFTNVDSIDDQELSQTLKYVAALPRPNVDSFQFSPVTSDEIKNIILSIKSQAVGCDNISRRMITMALDHFLPALTHLLNFSLTSGQFPCLWRKAHVRPLPKIPNPSLPSHFRPISILPFLSKILESCVLKQLTRFVHQNNLLSPFQSGFRSGHSTVSALLKVTNDVRAGVEESKVTILVLVDFSNAFNTVSHDLLLSILSHLKISPCALEWFSSYLRGRQQSVYNDEATSDFRGLNAGVPQGGILSPLLFSLFINHITTHLHTAYHLYADDLQLYTQSRVENLATAICDVNRDLSAIKDWSYRFGLAVNPLKCQAIILGSPRMISRVDISILPSIIFNGSIIPVSPYVKDLGLHIDATLEWRTQVSNISKKVTGTLRFLYRLKNFLPTQIRKMLVQTLIFPVIDYADVCYLDLNADLLNKLDRLLNNCIRFVHNLRKYDHISTHRFDMKWLPIRQRRIVHTLTTLYSLLNSPHSPIYLKSNFEYLCSTHERNLRSTNNLLLLCPSHNSSLVHSSFHIQSILLWNALPLEIRMATNRNLFKARVWQLYYEKSSKSS